MGLLSLFRASSSSSSKRIAQREEAVEEEGGEATERSPLLGNSSASRPQSAVVRHGRGLLSEDGDGDGDGEGSLEEGHGEVEQLRRNGHNSKSGRAGNDDDDDDESDDNDDFDDAENDHGGLLGWKRRRNSSSARKIRAFTARSIACYVLLAFLAVAFIVFAVVHVWIGRFMSEQLAGNGALLRARAQDALVYAGPDSVRVLSMDRDSTTVQLQMRMGIDVRTVFGWNGTSTTSRKLPLSRRLERKLIGWAARKVGQASMDLPEPVAVSPLELPKHDMLYLATQEPLALPLYFPRDSKDYSSPKDDLSWLKNVTITVPMQVVDPDVMATFVNISMAEKVAKVHVRISKARVSLGKDSDRGWLARTVRRYGGQEVTDIELDQAVDCECLGVSRMDSQADFAHPSLTRSQCPISQQFRRIRRI